jgi:hypothetical protein
LVNKNAINAEVKTNFGTELWSQRVLNGPSTCANVARSIVSVLNHVSEFQLDSVLDSIYAPLISVYALAIHILKNPSGQGVRADLEVWIFSLNARGQLPRSIC